MAKGDKELRQQLNQETVDWISQVGRDTKEAESHRRNKSIVTTAGREAFFLEQLRESLWSVFSAKLADPGVVPKKPKGKTERILNVVISDTHYGSNLDPREVGHRYGAIEEARRTAAICRQVASYKTQYRNETELYVHLLGDLIQGQLHDMRDGEPLADQVAATMRILAQAIRFFAVQFPKGVTIFATPGNHGRNTARHRDRATFQKWDANETHIYYHLKTLVDFMHDAGHWKHVKVELNYQPKYEFDLFGRRGFATHGDTVLKPGYPGKTIDAGGMKKQIDAINSAAIKQGGKEFSVVMVGHVHIGSMVHLPGGAIFLSNGCLLPPDPYANSIGIFDTSCGQWMFESTPEHPVGDARFLMVDFATDKDASLDDIIRPYLGLDK